MANSKISALTSATTPLAGTEVLPIVQSSATTKVSVANLTAGRAVSGLNFNPSGSTIPTNGMYLPSANAVAFATNTTLAATISSAQVLSTVNDATFHGVTVGLGAGSVATNTILGTSALATNSTGAASTAIGYNALNKSTGDNNTAVGYRAGVATTSASPIDAFGYNSLAANTTGAGNSGFGAYTLVANTSGAANTAVGTRYTGTNNAALYAVTTGSYNVAVGSGAGQSIVSTNGSTAVGYSALQQSTGASNTAFGYNSGRGAGSANANTTGTNNTYIGYQTVGSANNNTNEMIIGYAAIGLGSNTTIVGNSSTTATYNGNNSATWSITSDKRIKQNIVDVVNGLDIINALRPIEFDYILTGAHDAGFIAQEYQEVLPKQVQTRDANGKELDLTDDGKLLSINQNLVPYLVKAIQELSKKIAHLQKTN